MTKWVQDSKYKSVISFIERADDTQIDQIIDAVIRRYAIQFPDWEIMFLSMPRNDPDQRLKIAEFFFNSMLTLKAIFFISVTVVAKLFWISFTKPMRNPTRAIL